MTEGLELVLHPGRFAVCRDPRDGTLPPGPLAACLRRGAETTWIGPEDAAPPAGRTEGGWRALEIAVPEGEGLDFGLVGVLAAITGPLAAAGVPVFCLSTYDTDVVLVKQDRLGAALAALRGAGHRVAEADARSR